MRLEDLLQDKYDIIPYDKKLGDLVEIIKQSDKNIFAVCDIGGRFAGIIELNDIKQRLFEPGLYNKISIRSLVKKPAVVLNKDHSMHEVMEKFDITQSWYLPVLDADRKFLGFISKTKVFNKYREVLASQGDLYE
jgi:chloride channel protein, CIC family